MTARVIDLPWTDGDWSRVDLAEAMAWEAQVAGQAAAAVDLAGTVGAMLEFGGLPGAGRTLDLAVQASMEPDDYEPDEDALLPPWEFAASAGIPS